MHFEESRVCNGEYLNFVVVVYKSEQQMHEKEEPHEHVHKEEDERDPIVGIYFRPNVWIVGSCEHDQKAQK